MITLPDLNIASLYLYIRYQRDAKTSGEIKDKSMLERLESIAKMPVNKKDELFNVIDAYLRDFKTSQAYTH
ncbi:hypothetical protein [Reichenbachiella sp. MALMAid0571]|uniref:hypothetical protein n=1 Tax=Reichenbachiella sp. MALMAid0571 TaxID=3143939 RepID=UPI0032DE9730